MKLLDSFLNCLAGLLKALCALLVIGLPVTVFLKVFFRYVVGSPLVWSDEVIMLMLLSLTYLGSALAAHSRAHITVEILESIIRKKGPKALKIYHLILDIVFISVLLIIIYFGVKICCFSADQVTDILMISYFWIYSILPLGLLFMVLMILKRIVEEWAPVKVSTE